MHSQERNTVQLTFYYTNGQTESFMVFEPIEDETPQGIQLEVRHLLQKEWWMLSLPEQTVMVNMSNVLKVEIKPQLEQLRGDGVFTNAERVTALSRSR